MLLIGLFVLAQKSYLQNAITPGTQAELIKQVLLTEAEKDSIFKQLLVLQGQQFTDAIPQGAINTAIQEPIVQLS